MPAQFAGRHSAFPLCTTQVSPAPQLTPKHGSARQAPSMQTASRAQETAAQLSTHAPRLQA
jgi:hypothetical protein